MKETLLSKVVFSSIISKVVFSFKYLLNLGEGKQDTYWFQILSLKIINYWDPYINII